MVLAFSPGPPGAVTLLSSVRRIQFRPIRINLVPVRAEQSCETASHKLILVDLAASKPRPSVFQPSGHTAIFVVAVTN